MARTKKKAVRLGASPVKKVLRVVFPVKAELSVTLPHLYRLGMRAWTEIRKWRFPQPKKLQIRRLSFSLLLCKIVQSYMEALRFKHEAINSLRYTFDSYMVTICEDANLFERHAKRIIVYPKDISLVQRIRGQIE